MNTIYRVFLLFLVFTIISLQAFPQENTVSGKVIDATTSLPLKGAIITIGITETYSDEAGQFAITMTRGEYVLSVSISGYETYKSDIVVETENLDVGLITLTQSGFSEMQVSVDGASVSLSDIESDKVDQNISGILANSQDFILSNAAYNLSFIRFQYRGYASNYYNVYINGIPMNQAETGRPVWAEWGGLNDAMRNQESYNGLTPAHFGVGGIAGLSNINTRPTLIPKQQKFSYASSNRSYNNRITYTYGSGLMKNNWAFAVNASKRWAEEGYVDGTWYDAWSLFLSAEKRINSKHSIVFSAFASPYQRALQNPSTQEAYDLLETSYYNPNWGWQEGKMRNARIRTLLKPTFIANHYWNATEKLRINNALMYSFTDFGTTSLNWYDAPDPRPDYYRYLPSFQTDPYIQQLVADQWQTDQSVNQVNWNNMYQVNYLQNLEGKQAKYMIENRKTQSHDVVIAPNYKYDINSTLSVLGGVHFQYHNAHHFKTIDDLLGGEYWLDIDQFAERDFAGDTATLINNLLNPDTQLTEGDVFGYSYNLIRTRAHNWGLIQFSKSYFDVYAAYGVDFNQYQREGNMKNGRYPDNSLGKSDPLSFTTYSIKSGLTYKLSGRDFFRINIGRITAPPALSNVFVAPTIANKYIKNIDTEKILSGDLSYTRMGKRVSGRISVYQTYFEDLTSAINFYHDDLRTFVNLTQTGVDKVHQGVEGGLNVELLQGLTWMSYANIGNHIYTSRPQATISYANGSKPDTTKTIYSRYFFDTQSPQFVATSGLRYNSSKFWFASINVNYFDKYYMSFNPERRTEQAIANLGPDDPLIAEITEQYQFDSGLTVDVSFFKSWKIKNQFISLHIGINNVLNNQQMRTGGFEQMRFDFATQNLDKFPPKYFYGYGRNYFAMISYRF
jgi:hypothetical protein